MAKDVLEVKELKTYFYTRRGVVKAVDGVSFNVKEGETLGLVGESGCGKTITSLSILRLVPAPGGRIVGGQVLLGGEDLLKKSDNEMRKIRGGKVSMILQDPMTSLNPVFTVGEQVAEPIRIHQRMRGKVMWERVKEMLGMVKIPSPEMRMREHPYQMSGGMRQRIVGAIAISCQPQLLIADEPTTSLDVTIQAQFLRLLKDIQERFHMGMIMITHDLGIVAKVCDKVAVMYAGRIVESAPMREVFNHPQHPYTVALLNSLPRMDERREKLYTIEGQPPDMANLKPGCAFAPRCSQAKEICKTEYPPLSPVGDGHLVSCWPK